MSLKLILVILFFTPVFFISSPARPVLAERETPELEFLLNNARRELNKQEAVFRALRRRYEDILNREKELRRFIDGENKKIEELEISKNKSSVQLLKTPAPVQKKAEPRVVLKEPKRTVIAGPKRPVAKAAENIPKKALVLQKEKAPGKKGLEIAKREAVLDEILKLQEKNVSAVLKPAAENKKIVPCDPEEQKQTKIKEESLKRQISQQEAELREKEDKIKQLLSRENSGKALEANKKTEIEEKKRLAESERKRSEEARAAAEKKAKDAALEKKKQEQVKFLADQKSKEQKAREELVNKQKQEALAKKQEKEQELSGKKLEKERLLAEEKEERLMRERECQMKLLLEADKNAKHERYVSQLGQLLSRQNYLLEESRKLESQIHQEEETMMVLEKTRQELIRKLLENP